MIPKQLTPLFMFIFLLCAVYSLIQVIKLKWKPKIKKRVEKQPTYEWSDAFGLLRGYLGIVAAFLLYLMGLW